jgi:F0F1-type ATP synthase assembly protein I
MPSDNKQDESSSPSSGQKKPVDIASQPALALELPFTFVGAIVVGGAIGFFLDRWLHTSPWLMLLFGGFGFYAGIREVIRRLPGSSKDSQGG